MLKLENVHYGLLTLVLHASAMKAGAVASKAVMQVTWSTTFVAFKDMGTFEQRVQGMHTPPQPSVYPKRSLITGSLCVLRGMC
jgi:hypothetical protein